MENNKVKPWHTDVLILSGNIEELFGISLIHASPYIREVLNLKLSPVNDNIHYVRPLTISIDGFSSLSQLMGFLTNNSLRVANLREFLSFRRSIESDRHDTGGTAYYYIGEQLEQVTGLNQTIGFLREKGGEYRGLRSVMFVKDEIITADKNDYDYGYSRYTLVFPSE